MKPPIKSPFQQAVVDYLKKIDVSQRGVGDLTGISETTYGTWARMTSAMKLDMLDKILLAYPGTKQAIIDHLRGNTEKNLTDEPKSMDKEKHTLEDQLKIKEGIIAYWDDIAKKLQREVFELEFERDGLKKEVESLKDQLAKANAVKDGKK